MYGVCKVHVIFLTAARWHQTCNATYEMQNISRKHWQVQCTDLSSKHVRSQIIFRATPDLGSKTAKMVNLCNGMQIYV